MFFKSILGSEFYSENFPSYLIDMKESDWARWKELSDNSLLLDDCLSACDCVRRGWYDCNCIQVDNERWDQDFLYVRNCMKKKYTQS